MITTGLYTCSKTIENLLPDTTYAYKLQYSFDYISEDKHWSDWSNTVNLTTLSLGEFFK